MTKEVSVADAVRELLEQRPFLTDLLGEGLINHMALARNLIPLIKGKARRTTTEAVHVAIRRYSARPSVSFSEKIPELLAASSISLKDAIVDISLKRSAVCHSAVRELASEISSEGGEIYVIQGQSEILVILDAASADKLRKKVSTWNIRSCRENLSTLALCSPGVSADLPGFYYYILGFLARAGINIVDLVSTTSELILVIDEKDASRAYEVLRKLVADAKLYKQPKKLTESRPEK